MKRSERTRVAEEARGWQEYEVELAQGASHIASMLYPDTLRAAVQETVDAFVDRYGGEDLRMFVSALTTKMKQRHRPNVVPILLDVAERANAQKLGNTSQHLRHRDAEDDLGMISPEGAQDRDRSSKTRRKGGR
jgi:hypothetical protein